MRVRFGGDQGRGNRAADSDPGRSARKNRDGRQAAWHRHFPLPNRRHATQQASAEAAVRLVREGKAEMLMKGSLHTDELMSAVVERETGLRTARRISHCFVMDVPALDRALIITDAAVNIVPDTRGQGPHHPERD